MRCRRLLIGLTAASILPAAEAMKISELPAPPGDGVEIHAEACGKDCPALAERVIVYLQGRYSIGRARYFRVDRNTPWVAVYKTLASEPVMKDTKDVAIEGHREGIDRIKVWKSGWLFPDYAAVAINAPDGDGTLVGYFELKAQ